MPFEDLSQFHIGMNKGSSQVTAKLTIPAAKRVDWTLVDEHNIEVCRYTAGVLKNKETGLE